VSRKARSAALIAAGLVFLALWPVSAEACATCFGDPNSAETKGVKNAVFFMLGVIGLVQVGFVKMFWNFRQRARSLEDRKNSFRIVRGGSCR